MKIWLYIVAGIVVFASLLIGIAHLYSWATALRWEGRNLVPERPISALVALIAFLICVAGTFGLPLSAILDRMK